MQRVSLLLVLAAGSLSPMAVLARGDGTFAGGVLQILGEKGFQNSVSLAAGDFNGDGRTDLAAINGSTIISIALRGNGGRDSWTAAKPVSFGAGNFLVQAADLDKDGDADLAIADPASSAFVLWSNGDGTFKPGLRLAGSAGSRWIDTGDFDGDGKVDIASANWNNTTVTIHRQGENGMFVLKKSFLFSGQPHSIVAQDYSGDGKLDLLVGIDSPGILPLLGLGDGGFAAQKPFPGFGFGQCHRSIAGGDLNRDGLPDLVAACGVWLSEAGGTFLPKPLLPAGFPESFQHVDVGDANGDGFLDVAGSTFGENQSNLRVLLLPGKGDGSFGGSVPWVNLGTSAGSFLFEDIDGDRFDDVVAAAAAGTGLSVVWGAPDTDARDWSRPLVGFGPAKDVAFADMDRDRLMDIWVLRGDGSEVAVYLSSRTGSLNGPSFSIRIPYALDSLGVADLDGDGNLDLYGSTLVTGMASTLFLNPQGQVQRHANHKAGTVPANVLIGDFDADRVPDMIVPLKGASDLSFFRGLGRGAFDAAAKIASVPRSKKVVAGDLDADGRADLVLLATEGVSVHYGEERGGFQAAVRVGRNEAWRLSDVAVSDLDSDGLMDLVLADARQSAERGILIFSGKGNRMFAEPVLIAQGLTVASLAVEDFDGNGFPDLTAAQTSTRTMAVILNGGPAGIAKPVEYGLGFAPLGHRSADLNGDGALDLFVYSASSGLILIGNRAPDATFRRGDADGDGAVAVNDPVALLNSLFLGAGPVACGDGADADDSGVLDLADAIYSLNHQFLGGPAPAAPGPASCGRDETADAAGNDLGCGGLCK